MTELIPEQAVLALSPFARLHFDKVRDRHVLLAPERVLFPCPTTVTILEHLDGETPFGVVVDALAARFEAPREVIARDSAAMLDGLIVQRLLDVRREGGS